MLLIFVQIVKDLKVFENVDVGFVEWLLSLRFFLLFFLLLGPFLELLDNDVPDEKLELSLHGLLPHIFLLGDIAKALDFAGVDIYGAHELLHPVALHYGFELNQAIVPREVDVPENALGT